MPYISVDVDLDEDTVFDIVNHLSSTRRAELIADLVKENGLPEGDKRLLLEDEVVRLHDRVRYGGFDEGSALEVLTRLANMVFAAKM